MALREVIGDRFEVVAHVAKGMYSLCVRWNDKKKKDVLVIRNEEETLEKSMMRLNKKIKGDLKVTNYRKELIDSSHSNKTAWPQASSLTVGDNELPVFYNPPQASDLKMSCTIPMVHVPMVVTFNTVNTTSIRYSWIVDGEEVCTNKVFTPTQPSKEPIELRLTPSSDTFLGETFTIKSDFPVAPLLFDFDKKYGPWKRPTTPLSNPESPPLRVGSYNVLADIYAGGSEYGRDTLYPFVEKEILDISYRMQVILLDILQMNCDILSLQEVGKTFYERMTAILAEFGYTSWLEKKLGAGIEGVAIFWKKDRFEVTSRDIVPLGQSTMSFFDEKVNTEINKHLETKSIIDRVVSVAQIMIMTDLQSEAKNSFAFINTHLWYHPTGNPVRLLQLHALLSYVKQKGLEGKCLLTGDLNTALHPYRLEIEDINEVTITDLKEVDHVLKVVSEEGGPPSLTFNGKRCKKLQYRIETGDLMVDDECYEFSIVGSSKKLCGNLLSIITSNNVDIDHNIPKQMPPPCAIRYLKGDPIKETDRDWHYLPDGFRLALERPFSLTNPNDCSEFLFSTYCPHFAAVLDYTLFSSAFTLRQAMPHPDFEGIKKLEGIPSAVHPSDHIPLFVDLEYAVAA
eukprot:TRINITY_DN25357_c0_g1_i1.p1 TRINITY_DN25357_c0_g1~~TRINITY_DN25357_c0_g1_i1.p1  ORF type:complete len:625 (+),score=104.32 TRINITY_DN25357_c0_g1_i1:61-1935(+)